MRDGSGLLTVQHGQVTIVPPGASGEGPFDAGVEPGDDGVRITPQGRDPIALRYSDIDDLADDDYTLRLTDHTGRRYDLSMLGKAYGQVVQEITKKRWDQLQHDLLLTGIGRPEPFPGAAYVDGQPVKGEIRLFDDMLVMVPEHGLMWGLPYSFVDRVEWDPAQYQVRVTDDLGEVHAFGWLQKRSEQFVEQLQRRLDKLAARTARTLGELIPGLAPATLSALAGVMRDGRAVQQRVVDRIDPGVWPRLEDVVVGTDDLRQSYEALKAMTPPGWAALGVKAMEAEEDDLPTDVRFTEVGDRAAATSRQSRTEFREGADMRQRFASAGLPPEMARQMQQLQAMQQMTQERSRQPEPHPERQPRPDDPSSEPTEPPEGEAAEDEEPAKPKTWLWFFTPLSDGGRPINAVAQEVTSEKGHATYVYRLMDPKRFASLSGDALADAVGVAVARLNRALLTLNFRREPIYLPEEQIQQGRYVRYQVALRKLDYLQWARANFLGRGIHTEPERWMTQVKEAAARA